MSSPQPAPFEPTTGTSSSSQTRLDGAQRIAMIEELNRRYGDGNQARSPVERLRFMRKRHAWRLIVGGANAVKRAADVGVGTTMAMGLAPLLAGVAVGIKLTDGGPVLFWQKRVGKYGREFDFPKFRSMCVDAEAKKDELLEQSDHEDSVTFKMKRDPRVTTIGRFIRKLSIDELPQLYNVIIGEMSLVGPRPPVPREVEQYTLTDRRRLDITPGLTCIWQVSGRGDIPFDQQVELDVEYIESQSLLTDLRILFKTVPAVLLGTGAY